MSLEKAKAALLHQKMYFDSRAGGHSRLRNVLVANFLLPPPERLLTKVIPHPYFLRSFGGTRSRAELAENKGFLSV
jgi:hypothetical protein